MKRAICPHPQAQRGFGAIVAIVVLVILASLAAAIGSMGATQQIGSAQDILSTRAWQAAKAGNEYGLYQALKGSWTTCSGASTTLDLRTDTGFYVTVRCNSTLYGEGGSAPGVAQSVRTFEIKSVACPATTCPSSDPAVVASPGYVERTRLVQATN